MDSAEIGRKAGGPTLDLAIPANLRFQLIQLIGGGPGGGNGLRCKTDAPTLCFEILGNPRFQLIGGGPGGGNGLRRNPSQSVFPTLYLEILRNATKSMEILGFS